MSPRLHNKEFDLAGQPHGTLIASAVIHPASQELPSLYSPMEVSALSNHELGLQLREFLLGFLGERQSSATRSGIDWGRRVALTDLKNLYGPRRVEQFTLPEAGIDNLGLHSTDIFSIPGQGEFTVDFKGYFRVARSAPTTTEWSTAEVLVNIVELGLRGHHDKLGEISVRLNPDITSTGQILPGVNPSGGKKCRIATAAIFEIPQLGVSVFNKEPVLLMNEHVKSIPPVDDPNGHALLFNLPLYDLRDPNGGPLGYLTSLRYGADHYISEADVRGLRGLESSTRRESR